LPPCGAVLAAQVVPAVEVPALADDQAVDVQGLKDDRRLKLLEPGMNC